MDKLKEKLKKGLNLNNSSSGSSSFFSSKPNAFAGTGRKLGTAEAKAPPPPARPTAPSSSSSVPKATITIAPKEVSTSSTYLPPAPPPASPSSALPPPLDQPPLIDFTPHADDSILSAIDQLSTDPHCGTSAQIIQKILSNILANPTENKYRKIRLNNPKIQAAIVDSHGGVELILACGFVIVFESNRDAQQEIKSESMENSVASTHEKIQQGDGVKEGEETEEGFAILHEDADLEPLQATVALLQQNILSHQQHNTSALPPPPVVLQPPTAQTPLPPPSAAAPPKERDWAPPCARNTQIILPASVDTDVPSWFFERTGQDLKASFLAAVRKREQSQILMTKAMREKLAKNGGVSSSSTVATVKVRLPEGISLQGEFAGGEPVAVVFAWVADCLCDPLQTFDLVLPDRRNLEFNTKSSASTASSTGSGTGRIPSSSSATAIINRRLAERPSSIKEAGLMPSVTLNLRWTGPSAVEMKGVPALRRELYTQVSDV